VGVVGGGGWVVDLGGGVGLFDLVGV